MCTSSESRRIVSRGSKNNDGEINRQLPTAEQLGISAPKTDGATCAI